MAKHFFVFFIFLFLFTGSSAQLKKTQVLIYGDSEISWAAAVQSAKSGVNTLWLRNSRIVGNHFIDNKVVEITNNTGLDAGLWADFLAKSRGVKTLSDSISRLAKQHINPQIAQNIFASTIDSTKNLTVLFQTEVKSIKKSGNRWRVVLNNNERLKVHAIVDGSEDGVLLSMVRDVDLSKQETQGSGVLSTENLYENTAYRTGTVAFGEKGHLFEIPANLLLNTVANNFFSVSHYSFLFENQGKQSAENLPKLIQSGQAIGASAAYCAFFNTTTEKINVRTLQNELLEHHAQLIPFQDIDIKNVHFGTIQKIGLTGLLKGEYTNDGEISAFHFNPQKKVLLKEIEPMALNLYTRSQIWFKDHQSDTAFTLKDLLSLIKFTALKGNELDEDVKKGWKQRFHFKEDLDFNETVTREQFAVLMDYYLQPFSVKITQKGIFQN